MRAPALPAFTERRCGVSFSHTGSSERATCHHSSPSRVGMECHCLNTQVGKLRLLIISPLSAGEQRGAGM